MLPPVPKSLGKLSDVFVSGFLAAQGRANALGLKTVSSAIVILVDGLGTTNLKYAAGHARFLSQALVESGSIKVGFPSTTATSLTSLLTGSKPGTHGVIGYKVKNPNTREPLNLLTGWGAGANPEHWLESETLSQLALKTSATFTVIGLPDYKNSGFSKLTTPGAAYIEERELAGRLNRALEVAARPGTNLVYVYVPELDQIAHRDGFRSNNWLVKLEELDKEVRQFAAMLSTSAYSKIGALLTADHGVVDVPKANQIFLDEYEIPGLILVAGDPRANFIYLDSPALPDVEEVCRQLNQQFEAKNRSRDIYCFTASELIEQKWFGENISPRASSVMPDIFVLAKTEIALYHRQFAPSKSLEMVGQHGSISAEELNVPLLRFGRFSLFRDK